MKEQNVKKRAWVKSAAIVFLAIMLVLTLFSNTILNRSLPEVAARYSSSGSINVMIRGTGTVSANETYEVIINQTRTVRETHIRLGDSVETGDLLFTLADGGSEELESARERLRDRLFQYEIAVLEASRIGDRDYERELRDIRNASEELDSAQFARDEIIFSEESISGARVALLMAESVIDSAKVRVETAQNSVDSAKQTVEAQEAQVAAAMKNLADLGGLKNIDTLELDRQISALNTEIINIDAQLQVAIHTHQANYDAFVDGAEMHFSTFSTPEPPDEPVRTPPEAWNNSARRAAYLEAYAALFGTGDPLLSAYRTITGLRDELREKNEQVARLVLDLNTLQGTDNSYEHARLTRLLNSAEASLASAQTTLTSANASLAASARALADAEAARDAAKNNLDAQLGYKAAWATANTTVKSLQTALENLLFSFDDAQKNDGVTDAIHELNMSEKRREISALRAEIGKLENDSTGAEIYSPVSGLVRQINVSSGNQTRPGETVALIEVTDRGYSLSIPVSLEQSRQVAIGDVAEVTRMWFSEEIRAVLTLIRNDPQNPATGRILTFSISGGVESGDVLTLSVGQRSSNYDVVVPNSALRSDANGDFVLVVLARSTPLGNRYFATRADVMILASDDQQTAVSGGLSSWEFVITTSTRPIEPGMQVRLVDNP